MFGSTIRQPICGKKKQHSKVPAGPKQWVLPSGQKVLLPQEEAQVIISTIYGVLIQQQNMTRATKILVYILSALILTTVTVLLVDSFYFSSQKLQQSDIKPFTIKTFEVNNGWGYSVLIRNNEIIRQEMIPAIQQQSAFLNQKDAYVAAVLMIRKLREKKTPGLTKNEMIKSGIKLP